MSVQQSYRTGGVKLLIGWATVFALRLLPHPSNVEPVMATLMPYSKRYGALVGFGFAFLSIFLYDAVTSGIGSWTWITAVTYGVLGLSAYYWLRNRSNNWLNYVLYAIVGTLVYDFVTGVLMGPLLFGQPFMQALIGQIPFTAMHLAGNIVLAGIVSPALSRWVVSNEALESPTVLTRLQNVMHA